MSMNPRLSPRRIASPFCGTPMYTDRTIVANRPDIVLKSKKDKTCFLIDMTIAHDTNISITLQKQNLQEGGNGITTAPFKLRGAIQLILALILYKISIMLQTQRKVATKFIKAHRHMSRRGHFVSGDLDKKLCLCTTSLVLSTRTAVHKKSFFNLLRQNSRHLTKVYSGRMVRLICFSLHCSGFKVTLFVDAAEYVGPLADSVGAVVSVYLPLTKSNTLGENPIYVAPGSFVSVSLNAVRRLIYLCPFD